MSQRMTSYQIRASRGLERMAVTFDECCVELEELGHGKALVAREVLKEAANMIRRGIRLSQPTPGS